jgi:PAS domain S-box-containing protein
MGASFPLATLFAAVAFSVWLGGWGPAAYTAVLGYLICDWLFIPGFGMAVNGDLRLSIVSLTVFFGSCASIILLGEAMRKAQRQLEHGHRHLSTSNLALENRVEAQALLASIVASSDDAIISKTLQGIITSWNAGAERLFGYTAAEAIGQSILMLIPPEGHAEEATILDRIRRGERVEHLEVIRRRKDGRLVDVSLTVSPVLDRDGTIIGASKIARDITDRRRAMEEMQEADRRKDEFLATLAHELRNPLAPISSSLHVMRMSPNNPAAVGTAREIMERQVTQMVRLVDDLLDVARITTGKVELRREPIDLARAVQDAVETSAPVLANARQQLVQTEGPEIWVDGDRTRLAQVFANLLNNGAKYSEPGRSIEIRTALEGNTAIIRIKDSGIGIRREMLPRIFELFRQAEQSGRSSFGGLGIGLFIVKRLVEMHGGSVEAHSEGPGQGSEFMVRLPAIDPPAVTAAPVAAAFERAIPRRILVVDDNVDAAEALAAVLTIAGHQTKLAHDGLEALSVASTFKPDIVFLDIGMPSLDGHETARRIREQPWGQKVVLVALTGWGQIEDRRKSKAAGFNHHLVKPADPSLVADLIAKLAS